MVSRILIFMTLVLTFLKCKDSETFVPDPNPVKFRASAFVEVTDVNGIPVQDAQVELGNVVAMTDADGVVFLSDVTMEKSTYVKAKKQGFFHGSRRFYPVPDQTHFVKIRLLADYEVGNFHSAAGGIISLEDGITLDFPANAVVDHNGNTYTGSVSVSAQPISGNDPDLSDKMPGDLVGNREGGDLVSLGSMGMVVVELKSSNGDLLQIKQGEKVELRMEVPADLLAHAPATIPMWYFDEETGFWNEEGEASLEGNTYTAQVGHFSYWNYDAWFPAVKWGASFVYEDGTPASQVSVCITIIDLEATKCAYTNEDGIVCGLVAADELLLMEVMSPCGDVILSQQIGPFSDSTMMGPFTIPSSGVAFTEVSGSAINCAGEPVRNGFAKIRINDISYYTVLDSVTGEFSLTAMNCDVSDATITVVDIDELKQSLPQTYSYAAVIDAGIITVCENLTEYIDLEVESFPDHFVYLLPNVGTQSLLTYISASDSTINGYKYFYVNFEGTTPGTYTPQGFEIGMTLPTAEFATATVVTIQVTYYGGPGDYIQGTLNGTLKTDPSNGSDEYAFTGTFSVLRE
jgi:hypothetical protein